MRPEWVESVLGRSTEVAHFHIITDDDVARQQARRLLPDARLMLGQADTMRAPGVNMNVFKRLYPDGSRIEVSYSDNGPLVAKLFPKPIPPEKPQRDWREPIVESSYPFLFCGMQRLWGPGDGTLSPALIAWEPGAPLEADEDGYRRFLVTSPTVQGATGEGVAEQYGYTAGRHIPASLMDRVWSQRGAYIESVHTSWNAFVGTEYGSSEWCSDTETIYDNEFAQAYPYYNANGGYPVLRRGPIEDPSNPGGVPFNCVFVADPYEGFHAHKKINAYTRNYPKEYLSLVGDLSNTPDFAKQWRESDPFDGDYLFKVRAGGSLFDMLQTPYENGAFETVRLVVVSGAGDMQAVAEFDVSIDTFWQDYWGEFLYWFFRAPVSGATVVANATGVIRLSDGAERWPPLTY